MDSGSGWSYGDTLHPTCAYFLLFWFHKNACRKRIHVYVNYRQLFGTYCLKILSGRFLGIVSLVFSKFWHDARNPYQVVCDIARFSEKKIFCPKNWENEPKMCQKQGFLNILKTFVINFY